MTLYLGTTDDILLISLVAYMSSALVGNELCIPLPL